MGDNSFDIFIFLRDMTDTQSEMTLFLLSVLLFVMLVDITTGMIGSKVNPDISFRSRIGINGLLKKIAVITTLIMLIPLSVILPDPMGPAFLNGVYFAIVLNEAWSVVENLDKMGLNIKPIQVFLEKMKQNEPKMK